jgi:hypothetical protein
MPVAKTCEICGKTFNVLPKRENTARFCSYECTGKWRASLRGEKHPNWQGGERVKTCQHCQREFSMRKTEPVSLFRKRKFCSPECRKFGQSYMRGPQHYKWVPERDRKGRGGGAYRWAKLVFERDSHRCRYCGAGGVKLHAHHLKSWLEHKELRFDVENGVTACVPCHRKVHSTATVAKAVKSVKPLTRSLSRAIPSQARAETLLKV